MANTPGEAIATSKAGQSAIILVVITVIIIVVVLMNKYIKAGNSILEALGLKDSKDETALNADLASSSEHAAKGNWFTPTYHKSGKTGTKYVTRAKAEELAKLLNESVGYIYDDPGKAAGAIKQLQFKSQVSFVADVFQQVYKKDLKTYLDQGFDTEEQKKSLLDIYNYVKGLPTGLA